MYNICPVLGTPAYVSGGILYCGRVCHGLCKSLKPVWLIWFGKFNTNAARNNFSFFHRVKIQLMPALHFLRPISTFFFVFTKILLKHSLFPSLDTQHSKPELVVRGIFYAQTWNCFKFHQKQHLLWEAFQTNGLWDGFWLSQKKGFWPILSAS